MHNIPLAKPDITAAEKRAVLGVLNTSHLSLGEKGRAFQKALAKTAGTRHAVAVNSGTSALHLIMRALGVGKGDEVITTPFSFIASSNCILYEGAWPVFVDINPATCNIDTDRIEAAITKKTKAILAVDVFGQPADWDALQQIARRHRLFLIEDSAEALGSRHKGKPCGSFGDAAVFAFYPNKQITAGEGGAVLTDSKKIADLCQSMANQGRRNKGGKWLEHERLGYNYRLDEMSAALGLAQVSRVREILARRQRVADHYARALALIPGARIPKAQAGDTVQWFVYVILLPEAFTGKKRDAVMRRMAEKGIQCSNYFQPIHLQPLYRNMFGFRPGSYPVAESISARTLALPFFGGMTKGEIAYVVKNLKEIIS